VGLILSYFHGRKWRINYLTGGILGGVAVAGIDDEEDALAGSRRRYANIHRQLERWVRDWSNDVQQRIMIWGRK